MKRWESNILQSYKDFKKWEIGKKNKTENWDSKQNILQKIWTLWLLTQKEIQSSFKLWTLISFKQYRFQTYQSLKEILSLFQKVLTELLIKLKNQIGIDKKMKSLWKLWKKNSLKDKQQILIKLTKYLSKRRKRCDVSSE